MTTHSAPTPIPLTCLITGASGSNGRELVKRFIAQGVEVRAMVRDMERARDLARPGVELVTGDFDQHATLRVALNGIERAFLLTPSSEHAETQQRAFVETAQASGVKHIVKLSQLGARPDSPERFLRYHAAVEDTIRASGLDYTFLRPNLFMQTLLSFKATIEAQGAFFAAAGEGRVSVVDVRDIAAVAFAALTQEGHVGQTYDITGPQALTHAEMAAQLSHALGRTVRFVDVALDAMRHALLEAHFPVWQADGLLEEYAAWSQNAAAVVTPAVANVTGRAPHSFAEFARDYASELG